MTARHQFRIGNRRLGRDRAAIDATPAPPVGETLQLARERKGVDLYRAERETKIRLRYLSALEDSAYEDLPAPVYTKGFLRNYAIYLGLDPDDILERWRDEMDNHRASELVTVAPPPQPIAAPAQRLTITPTMLVAGFVALVIVGFFGYLGLQLMRYVETTPVELTNPRNVFSTIDAEATVLEGTSGPGALITIRGPGDRLYNPRANEEGAWSQEVTLSRGRNDFAIFATDPVTLRESAELLLTINVPLPPAASAGASPVPSAAPVLAFSLLGPEEGFASSDGVVVVRGITSGSRVTINSDYLGAPSAPGATPLPSSVPTATPEPSLPPSREPGASPTPGGSPGPIGPARDITIDETGAFQETLTYPIGRWLITVTAHGPGGPKTETRTITIAPATSGQIEVKITAEARDSWVKIVADGVKVPGYGSRTMRAGESTTVTAVDQLCLRAGNAGALHIVLNGLDLGFLAPNGTRGSWIFRPGLPPEPAPEPC